jgi:outer membrane protein
LKKLFFIFGLWILFLCGSLVHAQGKIGYIDSQRILQTFQEFIDAKNKLEEIRGQYENEYQTKLNEFEALQKDIESQSLLLSEEKKQEKTRLLQEKAFELDKYRYDKLGPEGELYKKNIELTQPIIDKVNKVIQQIGKDEEYDFIFDAGSGALVHALPKYDLTEKVLEQLNKGVTKTEKK